LQVWILSEVETYLVISVSLIGKTLDFGSNIVGSTPAPNSSLFYLLLLEIHVRNTTD
jgi:hypothetical protein